METAYFISGVIGTLLLAVGGYLISFGDHKISSIWFFFAGGVFLLLSAALYLHEHATKGTSSSEPVSSSPARLAVVSDADVPLLSASVSSDRESVPPTPTVPPAVITPTPESPVVKPKPRHIPNSAATHLYPSEIVLKIKDAAFHNRKTVAQAFTGMAVDWRLTFLSASRMEGSMLTFFTDAPKSIPTIMVICDLPIVGNERMPLMNTTDEFIVKGIIESADEYGWIKIRNPSIELV
jgi:hypothetical protein